MSALRQQRTFSHCPICAIAHIGAALGERTTVGSVQWKAWIGIFHEQHHLHYRSCGRCGRCFRLFWASSLSLRPKTEASSTIRLREMRHTFTATHVQRKGNGPLSVEFTSLTRK